MTSQACPKLGDQSSVSEGQFLNQPWGIDKTLLGESGLMRGFLTGSER